MELADGVLAFGGRLIYQRARHALTGRTFGIFSRPGFLHGRTPAFATGNDFMANVDELSQQIEPPPYVPDRQPDPEELLFGTEDAPPLPAMNIFPIEWHVETPKLLQIYEQARDPGWAPSRLPWDSVDPVPSPSISATRSPTGSRCCRYSTAPAPRCSRAP